MTGWHQPLLWSLIVLPALGGAICLRLRHHERLARRLCLALGVATLLLAAVVMLLPRSMPADAPHTVFGSAATPEATLLAVDDLSALMPLYVAALMLAVIIASPRHTLDYYNMACQCFTASAMIGTFVTTQPELFLGFWCASIWPSYVALRRRTAPGDRRLRRMFLIHTAGSILPLIAAVILGEWLATGRTSWIDILPTLIGRERLAALPFALLIGLAGVARMHVMPFHGYSVHLYGQGVASIATLAIVPRPGLYLLARAGIPLAARVGSPILPLAIVLGSATAGMAALASLVQRDVRRWIAYLAMSQSGLMLVGICSPNSSGVTGALMQRISLGIAITGLTLCVDQLEARVGTIDFRDLRGLSQTAPRLATVFLLFGLAAIGLPGTASFVAEDLMLHGVIAASPLIAALMLPITALNAIAFMRVYTQLFFGRAEGHLAHRLPAADLILRERVVAAALVATLIGFGLVPQPLINARAGSGEALSRHNITIRQLRGRPRAPELGPAPSSPGSNRPGHP